jgi:hypothetical protein
MKSLWPGASMMVYLLVLVTNLKIEQSIVIPLSRSAFSLSITHANLKDDLPMSVDSFSYFSINL